MKKLVAILISGLFASAAFAADPAPAAEKTASAPAAEKAAPVKKAKKTKKVTKKEVKKEVKTEEKAAAPAEKAGKNPAFFYMIGCQVKMNISEKRKKACPDSVISCLRSFWRFSPHQVVSLLPPAMSVSGQSA